MDSLGLAAAPTTTSRMPRPGTPTPSRKPAPKIARASSAEGRSPGARDHYKKKSKRSSRATRRTADSVDEQLLTHMQAHAIPGPWAAGERILVCVSEDPRAAGLVRYAKRLADRLHAPFTALCVETRRSLQWSEVERDRIADTLRLAEALGGAAR